MLEFQEKRKIRQILYSRPMLVVLSVIVAVALVSSYKMYGKVKETSDNRDIAERAQNMLVTKENELENHLGDLKTTRGIEEEIRKKFRVVKEGESVIIVVEDKENTASAIESGSRFQPLWDRIKLWLK
mgnify:CR=1 FL=1